MAADVARCLRAAPLTITVMQVLTNLVCLFCVTAQFFELFSFSSPPSSAVQLACYAALCIFEGSDDHA